MADDDTPFIKNQSPGDWAGEKLGYEFPNAEYIQWKGERPDSPLARNVWIGLKEQTREGRMPTIIEQTDMRIWKGAAKGWYRQCSIGYHEECSDEENTDKCKCPHHSMPYLMDIISALQRAEPGSSGCLTIAHDDAQWMITLQMRPEGDNSAKDSQVHVKTSQSLMEALKALVDEANINQV